MTLRIHRDVPSLRKTVLVREWKRSLRRGCERGSFRVVHYSLQRDHVHALVEAAGTPALACGLKSLGARLARCVNRVFGRSGPVLADRTHVRILQTPREVRNALAYVLLNVRKHWRERYQALPPVLLDEASSARWFEGWRRAPASREPHTALREVAPARTWLLTTGWRRHGPVDPAEVPGH